MASGSAFLVTHKTLEVKRGWIQAWPVVRPLQLCRQGGPSVDQPAKGVIPTLLGAKPAGLWAASG